MSACLFCRIIKREIPAEIVHEEPDVLAFKDIHPQAPTHLLIIPTQHIETVADLDASRVFVVDRMILAANQLARQAGLVSSGFRLVMNCGAGAGQSVWHLHLHLLGGRPMHWPPG